MELEEALETLGMPLNEASLTQIIKRIKKHRDMVETGDELARHLRDDHAFKQSIGTVDTATDQERKDYAALLKDPIVADAIESLPSTMKTTVERFSRLGSTEQDDNDNDAPAAARTPGPLANMPKKDQAIINQMQTEFIKAKTPQQKSDMIKKWTASTYNAKLYKLALKSGII